MATENQKTNSQWTWEQNKAFEKALVSYINDKNLDKLAAEIPGKTIDDVSCHLNYLFKDIESIESGLVPFPNYISSPSSSSSSSSSSDGANTLKQKRERRKGTLWSRQEHMREKEKSRRARVSWLFLYGLRAYGKGDWRSISRNCVVTRTPTQVASHAQKYFTRQNSVKKDRRRSSIHDITHVDGGDMLAYHGTISSQTTTDYSIRKFQDIEGKQQQQQQQQQQQYLARGV
ncbi:Myb domain plants domain-containing protein [Dioscorea alata]|uniref:Myb domain plants domain-containing protein n=1 Tax=Dioscorea alata TaxID=55571 RepID=A0ACB7WUM6_DIOAL|nr:Myb domain plants domain-containing protein [Dioscorea alata]